METYNVTIQTKENTDQKNNTEFKVILSLPDNCGSARLVDDMASVTICDERSEYALSQSVLQYLCVFHNMLQFASPVAQVTNSHNLIVCLHCRCDPDEIQRRPLSCG